MSPPSRDEVREKLAVAAESARTSVGETVRRLRDAVESRPGLARATGVWAIVAVVALGLVGIAVGKSGSAESDRSGQLVLPAITGTPRASDRTADPGTGAPPNPGAPPDPGRPNEDEAAQAEPVPSDREAAPPEPVPNAGEAAPPEPVPNAALPPAAPSSPSPSPTADPGAPAVPSVPTQRGAPPPSSAPSAPEEQPVSTEHVVARGETLAAIALRYGVPFEQIAADSGVGNPNRIRTGQRLVIKEKPSGVEVIEPGRTLSDYARSSGRGLDELMRMNPQLTDPDRILAGGRLYV